MKHSTIAIRENSSEKVDFSRLIVSVRQTFGSRCEIVVGYPGLPNVVQEMRTGDALLFETPTDGVLEVRAMAMNSIQVELLVSQVSPRLGIVGGFVDDDPNNSPFTPAELNRITESIKDLKIGLGRRSEIAPEQLGLITRKLDEIQAASQRLGRKDWINHVAGTLTAMCVSAAFAPEVSKTIFRSVGSAFAWLFTNALIFLP